MTSRIGLPGDAITLTVRFYKNDELYVPLSVSNVKIYDAEVGGTLLATLVPTTSSIGVYSVTWIIPSTLALNIYLYDEWTWQASTTLESRTVRYTFITGAIGLGDIYTIEPSSIANFEYRIQVLERAQSDMITTMNDKVVLKSQLKILRGM